MKLAKAIYGLPYKQIRRNGVYDLEGWKLAQRLVKQRKFRWLNEEETAEFIKDKSPEELEALRLSKSNQDEPETEVEENSDEETSEENSKEIGEVFETLENPSEAMANDPAETELIATDEKSEEKREKLAEKEAEELPPAKVETPNKTAAKKPAAKKK